MAQRTSGVATVVAAGCVVTRRGRDLPEVLLVHRPRYDDWSLPKGKVDPGEHPARTAVREVAEETGLSVRLGAALGDQHYEVGRGRDARAKLVHYWLGSVEGDDDVRDYSRGEEIDQVAWVSWLDALRRLSYDRDRDTLREAALLRRAGDTLVVLRHGDARARKSWRREDRLRPLSAGGRRQAERLAPVLAAYGATRLVSSPAERCLATLAPYAAEVGKRTRTRPALSEDGATAAGVRAVVEELRDLRRPAVLCTHRPVLPLLYDALGTASPRLEPAGMLVVHRRGGLVVAHHELPAPPHR